MKLRREKFRRSFYLGGGGGIMPVVREMKYGAAPEETVYIDLPNTGGLKIKSVLRGTLSQPLVVMMHGKSGQGNSLLMYLGARFLFEHGFASLRLWMYDTGKNTRNLLQCTLDTHVEDFATVVQYLRDHGVSHLFAIGHSYGGLTIIKSMAVLDGAVLWDPTHGNIWHGKHAAWLKKYPEITIGDIVVGIRGNPSVTSTTMQKQDHTLGNTSAWITGKGYPIKIITAGKGILSELGRKYFDAADTPKALVDIEAATHNFDDSDESIFRLFAETEQWFKEIQNGRLA